MSSPELWVVALLRWLLLCALAGAIGGIAGRALARGQAAPGPAALPGPGALRASLLGLAASAGLAIEILGDNRLAAALTHPSLSRLLHTGDGVIAVVELASFAVAALLLRLRRPGLSIVPLLAVVGAEGVRAHPDGIVPVGGAMLTWAHLLPAAMWAGMLWYTLRAAVAWRSDPAAVRRLVRWYSLAAAWLLTLVVVTGVVTALVLVPVGSLMTTTYGRVLIVKAALVAAAASLAVAGRIWLRRAPGPVPAPGGPRSGPALATRLEVGTLAVTAVLTVLTPPQAPIRSLSYQHGTSQR
ncbi:MAG TPA: CopD family protein [Streptosporangiaceae bacterium]